MDIMKTHNFQVGKTKHLQLLLIEREFMTQKLVFDMMKSIEDEKD